MMASWADTDSKRRLVSIALAIIHHGFGSASGVGKTPRMATITRVADEINAYVFAGKHPPRSEPD